LQALEIVAADERGLPLGKLTEQIGAAKSSLNDGDTFPDLKRRRRAHRLGRAHRRDAWLVHRVVT
jgi:hypothetical protein